MYRKFKRRWRRFQHQFRLKYPELHRLYRLVKFPTQLGLLVLTLWLAVSAWIDFAYLKPNRSPAVAAVDSAPATALTRAEGVVTSQPANPAAGAIPKAPEKPIASAQIGLPATAQKPAASATVSDSSANGGVNKGVSTEDVWSQISTRLGQPELAETGPSNTPVLGAQTIDPSTPGSAGSALTTTPVVEQSAPGLASDWIMQRNSGFVVQVASSTSRAELEALARGLRGMDHIAIYPFKQTNVGQLLLGLAVGAFDSYAQAASAVRQLPAAFQQDEMWIRSIGKLKSSILTVADGDTAMLVK